MRDPATPDHLKIGQDLPAGPAGDRLRRSIEAGFNIRRLLVHFFSPRGSSLDAAFCFVEEKRLRPRRAWRP